jgi:LemA protein
MDKFHILLVGFVIFIGFYIVSIYNEIIGLIEAIQNNKKQIDIQLDRRFKVFESLIETVKKYMDYEQTTLKDVVKLRNQAQKADSKGDDQARMKAEDKISKIASSLNVVFEQYPSLKANENVLQLQEEIVNTENKLSFSKQAFNDSIERYNALKKSFLQSIIVKFFPSKLDVNIPYWGLASEEEIKSKEAYKVKL